MQTTENTSTIVDPHQGISEAEAARRREIHGPNAIRTQPPESLFSVFFRQFRSLIVLILALAAGVSFVFGDWLEGFAILGVLLINAVTGFFLEWRAAQSMEALKRLDVTLARVVRDGTVREVPSEEVTVGDVLWLEAGDMVAADAQVTEASQLQTDESALTGESLPVAKRPGQPDPAAPLAEQPHRVFKGTAVVNGNGQTVVTGIGAGTELGKITELVETAGQNATPLEHKLESLTRRLIWLTAVLAVLFFVFSLVQGKDIVLMLKTSIALAIAAIPEGLAIVATTSLAYGMLRLARHNVIIKRLSSVETLGSATVVFSDKTGTMTLNQIEVDTVCLPGRTFGRQDTPPATDDPVLWRLVQLSVLCNNARADGPTPTGDPLEIALLQWAAARRIDASALRRDHPRTAEIAFSSDTRIMATLHQTTGGDLAAVKGAVEEVLARCETVATFTASEKERWLDTANKLAAKGLRTIAFAWKQSGSPFDDPLQNLTWAGLIGFLDPPRLEVVPALQSCHEAGIRVIMVTGDHPATAQHIAEITGLSDAQTPPMTGSQIPDLSQLNEPDRKRLLDTRVFARVSPAQKLGLISLYQAQGDIVGMTGDGINDAPALKKADIGIAMGLRGTQVARETADMVLKDDSFVSVVTAIAQGRVIFGNIRRFIMYLVSCNLSEIFVVTASGFLGLGLPLTPLQILFLNVITDVFPALALGVGSGDKTVMRHPPRDPRTPLLDPSHWRAVVLYATLMTASVLGGSVYSMEVLGVSAAGDTTVVFYGLSLAQLLHVFNMRAAESGVFRNEITRNRYVWLALVACGIITLLTYEAPVLRQALNIETLHSDEWAVVFVSAVLPLVLGQVINEMRKGHRAKSLGQGAKAF